MATRCRDLYPNLTFYLYDSRKAFSAPFTVFSPQRATLYAGGLFFVFTASEHVRVLNRRFDDLVRMATVQPNEVADHLAALTREVG